MGDDNINNLKKLLKFHVISFIFVSILGTLLHFAFDFFNSNPVVAIFSSTNESTWEHLKLLFFPMLLSTIIGYFYLGKDFKNYFCARAIGIVSGLAFIIIFFYTYTGIIGTNYAILDISSFFIAVIIGEYRSFKEMLSFSDCNKTLSIGTILILLICFALFTYYPPKINLFKDPVTQSYGILSSNNS